MPQLAGHQIRGPTSAEFLQDITFEPGEPVQVVLFPTQGFSFVGLPLGRVRQVLVEQLVPVPLQFPADCGFGPPQRFGNLRLGLTFLK